MITVSIGVCVSVREHISETARSIFTKFRGYVTCDWRCDVLCTSGFVNDVIFSHSGTYGGMLTSLQCRAKANAPAAWCWLRPDLDDQDQTCKWCGGGVCVMRCVQL